MSVPDTGHLSTSGPNFIWQHLQLLNSGCCHEKTGLEVFVAKSGNELVMHSREVLIHLLWFVSPHSESLDFLVDGTKIRRNFQWEKIHMKLKGHSILSMCLYITLYYY